MWHTELLTIGIKPKQDLAKLSPLRIVATLWRHEYIKEADINFKEERIHDHLELAIPCLAILAYMFTDTSQIRNLCA